MKTFPTIPDAGYVITVVTAPCNVSAVLEGGTSILLLHADKTGQFGFIAPSSQITVDDDAAIISKTDYSVAMIGTRNSGISTSLPAGLFCWWTGQQMSIPEGWLLCNGALLSIAEYSALYDVIGTTYGGNGTTHFALPNLINSLGKGMTVRAATEGNSVGSVQMDAQQRFTGYISAAGAISWQAPEGIFYIHIPSQARIAEGVNGTSVPGVVLGVDNSRVVRTDDETRMTNIAYYPIIKF